MRVSQAMKATVLAFLVNLMFGYAYANVIQEIEPNNSIDGAQNIDASFSVGTNPDIVNSTTWPWVSISGSGDGSWDYYSFEVPEAGAVGVFDIDYGWTGFGTAGNMDTELFLYNSDGDPLANDDDSPASWGESGSISGSDAYIQFTFPAAGTYTIVVGEFNSYGNQGVVAGNSPDAEDTYILQVSLDQHILDTDGDGVVDEVDCQPYSDLNATVMLEGCDTGTENILMEGGCSITDLVTACADDSKNKGSFSNCVTDVTKVLKKEGVISGSDFGAIQSCATRSDIEK